MGLKNLNIELATLNFLHELLPALEGKNCAISIFLNCSACVNHLCCSILYDKLEKYGISDVSLIFINPYSSDRSQFVCYDAVKSSAKSQYLGVIQSTETGTLFFPLYIPVILPASAL